MTTKEEAQAVLDVLERGLDEICSYACNTKLQKQKMRSLIRSTCNVIDRSVRSIIQTKIEAPAEDEVMHGVDSIESLRKPMIELRDEALRQCDFDSAVMLSHVIAWMSNATKRGCECEGLAKLGENLCKAAINFMTTSESLDVEDHLDKHDRLVDAISNFRTAHRKKEGV